MCDGIDNQKSTEIYQQIIYLPMALRIYLDLICLWLSCNQIVVYDNHGYNIGSGFEYV